MKTHYVLRDMECQKCRSIAALREVTDPSTQIQFQVCPRCIQLGFGQAEPLGDPDTATYWIGIAIGTLLVAAGIISVFWLHEI